MTPEELQNTIDFIVRQQAQFSADIQREHEERLRDREEIVREQRRTDQAMYRMAEAIQTIARLLVAHSNRLDRLEQE